MGLNKPAQPPFLVAGGAPAAWNSSACIGTVETPSEFGSGAISRADGTSAAPAASHPPIASDAAAAGSPHVSSAGFATFRAPFVCDAPLPLRLLPRSVPRPRPLPSTLPRPRAPRAVPVFSVLAGASFGLGCFFFTSPHCETLPEICQYHSNGSHGINLPLEIRSKAKSTLPSVSFRAKTRSSSLQPGQTSLKRGTLLPYFLFNSPTSP